MIIYEYKCEECGDRKTSTHRDNRMRGFCETCREWRVWKRVFGFAMKPIMHEHFNRTVGKPISDMKKFKAELDRMSDEAEARTGIPHRYAPIDMNDREALGVTNEGIEESNRRRAREGAPLLPEIK